MSWPELCCVPGMAFLSDKPGSHHARYIDPSVPYHVFGKTLRGEFLLRPSPEVNAIMIGVLSRAKENWPKVRLYAAGILSNHFHLQMQGESYEFSSFVGFFEREVSRRLGKRFNEPGTYWQGRFSCTALPTAEAQERCLKYILSNSVKEHLVDECRHWPGVHSATALTTGKPLEGVWLDSTAYGRASRRKNKPKQSDYYIKKTLVFDKMECWGEVSDEEHRAKIKELVREVESEARAVRKLKGIRVLGAKAVRRLPRRTRVVPKSPAWFEERRRTLCAWVNPFDNAVKQFVSRYRQFQISFREASEAWRLEAPPDFPQGSWAPARAIA